MKKKEELIQRLGTDFDRVEDMSDFVGSPLYYAYMTKKAFDRLGIDCILECCGYGAGETEEEALRDLLEVITLNQP